MYGFSDVDLGSLLGRQRIAGGMLVGPVQLIGKVVGIEQVAFAQRGVGAHRHEGDHQVGCQQRGDERAEAAAESHEAVRLSPGGERHPVPQQRRGSGIGAGLAHAHGHAQHERHHKSGRESQQGGEQRPKHDVDRQHRPRAEAIGEPAGGNLGQGVGNEKCAEHQVELGAGEPEVFLQVALRIRNAKAVQIEQQRHQERHQDDQVPYARRPLPLAAHACSPSRRTLVNVSTRFIAAWTNKPASRRPAVRSCP